MVGKRLRKSFLELFEASGLAETVFWYGMGSRGVGSHFYIGQSESEGECLSAITLESQGSLWRRGRRAGPLLGFRWHTEKIVAYEIYFIQFIHSTSIFFIEPTLPFFPIYLFNVYFSFTNFSSYFCFLLFLCVYIVLKLL